MSDEAENNTPTEPVAPAQAPPAAPPEGPKGFSQEEVNAIVAREVAKAERRAKKAPQPTQEPTTDIGDHPVIAGILETLGAIAGTVKEQAEKTTQSERIAKFAQDTAGIELSESKRETLKFLQAEKPDLYAKELADLRAKDSPPAPKGEGFKGVGAPNAVPNAVDPTNPNGWSKDDVATMRANGTFLSSLKAYRQSMPGGSGGLFPLKTPGKKGKG